jgi:hypothetical protein
VKRYAAFFGAGLTFLTLSTALVASAPPKEPTSFILFSVEAGETNALLDPIAVIGRDGTIREPFPSDSEAQSRRFIQQWLKPGRAYPIVFGGASAGTATVRESPGDPGISLQAPVTLKNAVPLKGSTMALATSKAGVVRPKSMSRRPLTLAETAAVLKIAQAEFRKNGVSQAEAVSAKILSGSALNLDGLGRSELIARIQAGPKSGPGCDLFMIAEPHGASDFATGLCVVNKNKATASMEDIYYTQQDLVDALDVDRDGIAEVVTRSVYYESHDYTIFKKRRGGTWRKVYRGAGGGV